MRWVVALLLLANIVAGYWFSGLQAQRLSREQKQIKAVEPAATKQLKLLSEIEQSPQQETVAVPNTLPATASVICTLIGPFPDSDSAESLSRGLRVVGAEANLQTKDITTSVDYWVYLSPLPSPRAANRLFQELQSKKIDSYIFPGGELENGISLGVFGKEENAIRHRNNIRERGYPAELHEIPRISRQYWLSVKYEETLQVAESLAEELPKGVTQQEQDCGPH